MKNRKSTTSELALLQNRLIEFVNDRDWDQFHSPKNLTMALVSEVGELVEHFQWLTQEQSRDLSEEKLEAVSEELADIQIYLLMLAYKLEIDLFPAVAQKIRKNAEKYPAEKARGSSQKYTDL